MVTVPFNAVASLTVSVSPSASISLPSTSMSFTLVSSSVVIAESSFATGVSLTKTENVSVALTVPESPPSTDAVIVKSPSAKALSSLMISVQSPFVSGVTANTCCVPSLPMTVTVISPVTFWLLPVNVGVFVSSSSELSMLTAGVSESGIKAASGNINAAKPKSIKEVNCCSDTPRSLMALVSKPASAMVACPVRTNSAAAIKLEPETSPAAVASPTSVGSWPASIAAIMASTSAVMSTGCSSVSVATSTFNSSSPAVNRISPWLALRLTSRISPSWVIITLLVVLSVVVRLDSAIFLLRHLIYALI